MAVLIILFFSACNRVMVINISFEDVPSQTPLPATLTAIQKLIPPTETPTPTPTATLTPTLTPTPTSSTTPTITNTPPPTQTPTPSCLRLLTPSDGSLLKQIGRIYFTWEELPNAAGYIIEFTSPDGVPVRFKAASAEHLRYAESLPWGGVFTWRVIALDWDGSELCSTNSWRFSKPAPPPTDVPPTATSEERWDWWGRHGTPHPPHHHHP